MAVTVGTQLGSHEITGLLGKGGMGEVYLARDLKLRREVAIKILPEEFSRDADRVSRFQREAEVLASLNHPNIAGIHSLEEARGARFLVLELVKGETLAEKLKRGPVSIEEALRIGKQICGALEAAHEKGVVHRDLKPPNVKITPEGTVKLLDFGLARLFEIESQSGDPSNSPTLMSQAGGGVILGTAAYMSPEQARGQGACKQSDIWAFGCVLFEMLTGRQPFAGDTVTDILARIVTVNPDFKSLPEATPPPIQSLIRRCLEKDRQQRLHDIADARIEISEVQNRSLSVGSNATPVRRAVPAWAILAALLSFLVGSFAAWLLKPGAHTNTSAVVRLSAALPPGDVLGAVSSQPLAISPDGSLLTYVGAHGATEQLYLRNLGSIETKLVPSTEGAKDPFFSPDGRWIGFFADGKLQKVSVSGGTSQTIGEAPLDAGGSWGEDDSIYFSPSVVGGLWSVPAVGGKPQELTKLDGGKGEISHRWPQLLPGGRAILFTVFTGHGWDEKRVELLVLKTGERRVLLQGASTGRYISSGHVVYSRAGTLTAVPFDLQRLAVRGSPVALAEQVEEAFEGALYAPSDSGTLAYVPGSLNAARRRLVWVNRSGEIEALPAPARAYDHAAISPDGRYVALGISEGVSGVWTYDFARSTLTPLTPGASSYLPVWMPDGNSIIFQGIRGGFGNLFRKAADGSGEEERLTTAESFQAPGAVSRDGKSLVFHAASPATGPDIFILPLDGDRKVIPFLKTPATEIHPQFSPDGGFLAYSSDESGRFEVYVRPLSGPPRNIWQISTDGGREPVWSRNGRELFYRNADKMMVVNITAGSSFTSTAPRLLFERHFAEGTAGTIGYDVSIDGQRFVMIQPTEPEQAATQIHVVLNWFEELKQRVPTR